MDEIVVKIKNEPELDNAILIEGLPGVGNVGKLAVEHLVDEIEAEKLADIYSIYFPPQVLVDDDGVSKLVKNELYFKKSVNEDKNDLIILTGDYQGMTPQGQYKLTDKILTLADEKGVEKIISLGGYGQGETVDEPRVLGAATDPKLVEVMKEHDVTFSKEHPSSGIVGASGLLLGLGKEMHDIDAICLMGETSGYFVDPGAAQAVLEILADYIGLTLDYDELEDKAEEVESLTSKVKDMDMSGQMQQETGTGKEDLSYIG